MNDKEYFNQKMQEAIYCFDNYVRPILEQNWKYDLFRIENIDDKVSKSLDVYAGIDMFGIHKDFKIIRGISLRNQVGIKNYRTFTIREQKDNGSKNTELAKRIQSIDNDCLYPYYAIQSYVDLKNDKLLGFGIAKTKDIIDLIKNNKCKTLTGKDNQIFKIVSFDDVERYEYIDGKFKKQKVINNAHS